MLTRWIKKIWKNGPSPFLGWWFFHCVVGNKLPTNARLKSQTREGLKYTAAKVWKVTMERSLDGCWRSLIWILGLAWKEWGMLQKASFRITCLRVPEIYFLHCQTRFKEIWKKPSPLWCVQFSPAHIINSIS